MPILGQSAIARVIGADALFLCTKEAQNGGQANTPLRHNPSREPSLLPVSISMRRDSMVEMLCKLRGKR